MRQDCGVSEMDALPLASIETEEKGRYINETIEIDF